MSAETRTEWVCTGCRMTVRNACGDAIPAPVGWDLDAGTCLRCRTDEIDPEEAAEQKLLAGRRPNEVRRSCGLSPRVVKRLHRRLVEEGRLDPEAATEPGPPDAEPRPERKRRPRVDRAELEARLREDPKQSNEEIARATGCSKNTVIRLRRRLGLPSPPSRRGKRPTAQAGPSAPTQSTVTRSSTG